MNDLDEVALQEATWALGERRRIFARYTTILDAQRAALKSDNIPLMANLAQQVDAIIADLYANWQRIAPYEKVIAEGSSDGPNTQTVRDLMTAVAAEAALAEATVRDLTKQLLRKRRAVRDELELLDQGTPEASYHSPGPASGAGGPASPYSSRPGGTSLFDAEG